MEASQPRFTTLNAVHFSNTNLASEPSSFHLFTRLPAEIRLKIWEFSLPSRQRLLPLRLDQGVQHGSGDYQISIEQLPRAIPQSDACIEAREVARQHFRVPLPVNASSGRPLTIWLNPESDYIFLPKFKIDASTFTNFINDLRRSDPQGKGILHIGFDSLCQTTLTSLRALGADLDKSDSQDAIRTLRDWISELQSVWFIHLLSSESRLDAGAASGTRNYTIKGLNRSIPIFPHAVEFDLFKEDIRPIQPSLKSHTVWYSPTLAVQAWEEMESKLGIGAQPTRQVFHILAVTAREGYARSAVAEVRCAKTLDDYLELEQRQVKDFFENGVGTIFPEWQETEECKKNLLSAAGFWVFPSGTFDTLDESLAGKACQDLSDQHPGLGLFEL